MTRAWAIAVNLVLCTTFLAPAVPAVVARDWDSFPLSYYPMFSESRGATETVRYVQLSGPGTAPQRLPYTTWTTGGFNQGSMQLKSTERQGPEALDALCARIADRVAGRSGTPRRARVEILRGEVDVKQYFIEGRRQVQRRRVLTRCPVPR